MYLGGFKLIQIRRRKSDLSIEVNEHIKNVKIKCIQISENYYCINDM